MDLDELQIKMGGMSYYQISLVGLVTILAFGSGLINQSSVFLSAVPDFRCRVPPLDDLERYPELADENISNLIPHGDRCMRYDYNLSSCNAGSLSCISESTNGTIPCDHGYVYEKTYYESTTISEWDLVCDRVTLDSVANSLFFVGMLLGSALVGPIMDWFGRRIALLITGCGIIASGIAASFSPSYEVYIAMRVLVAMSSIPCYVVYYTYLNEITYTKRRFTTIVFANLINALSHTILAVLGMLIRDWRYFGLCISLFPTPYLIIFFFIPESPRWLIGRGKTEKARKVIDQYAKSLKTTVDDADWEAVIKAESRKVSDSKSSRKHTVLDLYRLPLMRVVSINTIYLWCTASILFYGLTLNVGRLSGDPHVNSILNASVEIVAYLIMWGLVKTIRMRLSCSVAYTMGGVCCLTTMLLTEYSEGNEAMTEAARWIAFAGKLFSTITFGLVYQYTAELYPTIARGTAMSMGSMAARIGTIILPFTLQLQEAVPWLTQTIFGVMGIIAGISSLMLPETSATDLLSTFEQAENFYRQEMRITASLLGKADESYIAKEKDGESSSSYEKSGYDFDYDKEELKSSVTKL